MDGNGISEKVYETLDTHPYVYESGRGGIASELLEQDGYDSLKFFGESIIDSNSRTPIDAIIGDDVSGRVPTLMAHHIIRYVQAAGQAETIPRTFFMASGRSRVDGKNADCSEIKWYENIIGHAEKLVLAYGLQRVLFITEITGTGKSINRLMDSFLELRVKAMHISEGSGMLYLGGQGNPCADRSATGVEKFPPEPVSRRLTGLDSQKVNLQRSFIADYSRILYMAITGEKPPSLEGYAPVYSTEPLLPGSIGILGTDKKIARRAKVKTKRAVRASTNRQLP